MYYRFYQTFPFSYVKYKLLNPSFPTFIFNLSLVLGSDSRHQTMSFSMFPCTVLIFSPSQKETPPTSHGPLLDSYLSSHSRSDTQLYIGMDVESSRPSSMACTQILCKRLRLVKSGEGGGRDRFGGSRDRT